MPLKNYICMILILTLLLCSSYMDVSAQEADAVSEHILQTEPVLRHNALSEMTIVGSMRQNRIPTIAPITGQDFVKAIAVRAVDSPSMSKYLLGIRLESNYIEGKFKTGDIAVISAWMKTEGKSGTASARLQTSNNGITVDMGEVQLSSTWKKYYFIGAVESNMDTVKSTVYVGYQGQLTYFADMNIEAFSGATLEEVQKLCGVEGANKEPEIDAETIALQKEKKEQALKHISTYICDVPKAYIQDQPRQIDEYSTDTLPFLYNKTSVFIPLRFAAEQYGADVSYHADSRTISILLNGKNYDLCFDGTMWKSDGKNWRAQRSLIEKNGHTFIAAEDFSGLLGMASEIDIDKKLCILSDDANALATAKEINYKDEIYERVILIPEEYYKVALKHDKLECAIGIPALIEVTDKVPSLAISSEYDAEVDYAVLLNNTVISSDNHFSVKAGQENTEDLSAKTGSLSRGEYKVDMTIHIGSATYYDAVYFFADAQAEKKNDDSKIFYRASDGSLVSVPDYRGNRIPDYSGVGYKNGKENIPDVPAVVEVSPSGADDTAAIQAAIDYVSALPERKDGIRGAVQLTKGVFQVEGTFSIKTSGVVIRGAGNDNAKVADAVATGPIDKWIQAHKDTEGTIILLTTKVPESMVFNIQGAGGVVLDNESAAKLADTYVPTGAYTFRVDDAQKYKVGDEVVIKQVGNMAWVHEIGMDQIPGRSVPDANSKNNADSSTNQWKEQTWQFERTITAIDENKITVDLPIVNAIDRKFGGAVLYHYNDDNRLQNVGIENMRLVAAWTPNENNVDETYHAAELAELRNAKDLWFRDITTEHLNTYNITVNNSVKRVTVQDFYDLVAPISFYMGEGYESTGRTFQETQVYVGRYGVYIGGQQVLVQRYHGINLRHLVEYMNSAAGPNVAYDAESLAYFAQMGPHALWSMGGLYDNINGQLYIQNRLSMGSGHGWAGAWFTAWNTTDELAVQQPPSAQNWAIGHVGPVSSGSYPQYPKGYWDLNGTFSNIHSIFLAQTEARYGQAGLDVVAHQAQYDPTIHEVPSDLYITELVIDGKALSEFDKSNYQYSYTLSNGTQKAPEVTAKSEKYQIDIHQADSPDGIAELTVSSGDYSQKYTVNFSKSPYKSFRIKASADDGNIPENVADNDFTTRWSASGDGQWLQYELENPTQIDSVGVAFYNGSKRSTKFDIQISDDAKEWQTILSATASGLTEDLENYTVKPFTAKYIRLVGHGNNLNAWNSVSEIRFYSANGAELFND